MANYLTPPPWQKDAVPTPQGWKHPRTGELLVSIKLDMSQFQTEDVKASEAETEEVLSEPPVEEAVEEVKAVDEPAAPKKKSKKA